MIGKYSDEMTFDYIMNRMLESVPDTVDKREGSIIYDALAPAAAVPYAALQRARRSYSR